MDSTQNQKTKAVALKYDSAKSQSPKIVAKGVGKLAERIIQVANEHNVAIHEDPNLAEVLTKLELNTEIPPDLYQAVAEILVFVYNLNKKFISLK
ncbi:MAG: EscU/YscU/HrcU family type III secretion system export apparatus switch protein [bacterium]|nr:EscU/YscU/HrcU family type III secretion system export apparatus switch protein [bacterium]